MARESKSPDKKTDSAPPPVGSVLTSRPFAAAEGTVEPGAPGAREERSAKPREEERSLETLQLFEDEEEEEELL